jgi:hypothetical protein
MVMVAPGMSGAIVEFEGKQASGEHPAGKLGYDRHTLVQFTWNPWGVVPVLVSVSVTMASFWVAMMFFVTPPSLSSLPVDVNPVSLTARAIV